MLGFTIRRLLRGVITLWLVVSVVFLALRVSGDPAMRMLGDEASSEAIEALREDMGLNEPIPVQYARYLEMIARGNFGDSLRERRPVTETVLERVPATLELAAAALALSIVIGIPAGVLAALRRNSLVDRGVMALAFLGQSAPAFFIGILLILCFSLWLKILPSSGRGGPEHLLMPALTLSSFGVAGIARLTRSSVLEVLNQDFVQTARAKGLREPSVQTWHVLRNAAIPIVTILGLQVGLAISGAVVTETVFAWPGMGRLAVNAVFNRDYPVVQFIVLLVATSVIIINSLVDILYGWLDPRMRSYGHG